MKNLIDLLFQLFTIFVELEFIRIGIILASTSLHLIFYTFTFAFSSTSVGLLAMLSMTLYIGFYISRVGLQYSKYMNDALTGRM